jgi:uncharacterized protein YndB with AHSA1/START domain
MLKPNSHFGYERFLAGLALIAAIFFLHPALFAQMKNQNAMSVHINDSLKGITIHQEVYFKVSPQKVYEALLSSKQFSESTKKSYSNFSISSAKIDSTIGGTFAVFDGHIIGRILELVPNQRIVQAWRVVDWPAGVYSIARYELKVEGTGTQLIFDHIGFPEGLKEHLSLGWQEHYWDAASMKMGGKWGEALRLDQLPSIDAIVMGCVAVTRDGRRLGKGHGYADLEYAILRELGHPAMPVATTVHALQIVEEFPTEAHDVPVSIIATSNELIEIAQPLPVAQPTATYQEAASVIANRESGVLYVRATTKQHERVQEFLDQVLIGAKRQVLIEATVAEVQLRNEYQRGISWERLRAPGQSGVSITQPPITPQTSATPGFNPNPFFINFFSAGSNLNVTLKLLEQFGDVKVLSSPKISVLNNQTALLKVVDGKISRAGEKETVSFGQLTKGQQLLKSVTDQIATIPASDWKVAGTSVSKVNGRDFVTGKHRYTSDIKRDGMLHGKVLRPSAFGATRLFRRARIQWTASSWVGSLGPSWAWSNISR